MALGDLKPRKVSAVVRANLVEIERSLDRGLTREQVWEELKKEHGLEHTFHAFYTALQRERTKAAQAAPTPPQPEAPRPQAPAPPQPEKVDCAIQNSGDPAEEKVDCAIQKAEEDQTPVKPSSSKNAIRSTKQLREGRNLNFDDLTPNKY